MKPFPTIWQLIAGLVLVCSCIDCKTVPVTGRKQLNLVPNFMIQAMAFTEYDSVLMTSNVMPPDDQQTQLVIRVGTRIQKAVEDYMNQNGFSKDLKGFKWEYNLINENTINAWCMPGGKVVVYTGLLPVTQNETALAIVLGHEITHAVAGHGRERMSHQMLAQGIQVAGNVALGSNPNTVSIFNQVYAPASQVGVLLPYGRKHEYEADHYGLIFAAMAGYDPREAIPFWQRMTAMGGQKPPMLLSDHPADADRIQKLQQLMPEALKYYNQ